MTWVWLGLAAAGVAWLWHWGTRPAPNELSAPGALAVLLRYLLSHGVYKAGIRGSLTVCVRVAPERRLVFTKYIREPAGAGFEAEFPLEAWSEPYYAALRDELVRRGVPHGEVARATGPALTFDFGRDFGLAHAVTRLLFEDAMRMGVARDCIAYYRDTLVTHHAGLTGVDAPED